MTLATEHRGRLHAAFATRADGATVLDDIGTATPLRLAPVRRRADGGLDVTVTECSPGLLPGDSYELEWQLAAGAHVRAGTQAALRVHGSSAESAASRLVQRIEVGDGASFELVPEPVVLHAGAVFAGSLDVSVTGAGRAVVCEVYAAGRIATGERFDFASCHSRVDARLDGRLVHASSQRLEPSTLPEVTAPGLLGDRGTHWMSLIAVTGGLDAPAADALRVRLTEVLGAFVDLDCCVDLLPHDAGVLTVATATSAWELVEAGRALAAAAG